MDITIVMLNGTSHTLSVHPGDTVGSLKQRIQDKFGVPCEKQKLMFVNGQKTHLSYDVMSISSYGLHPGAIVSLLVIEPPTIQVFVRNLEGKSNTYDIKADETVALFKSKVQSREGVPVSQQRLIHQGREMREGRLADYDVTANSTIDMSTRLRGG
uniref:polyubiquitin-like n=1 Tax=Epinephelus lanceolatus TaxID=310571 RepID=UPI001445DAB2|nr:polyubiquitin-like [Epinephelus lanceolatus]